MFTTWGMEGEDLLSIVFARWFMVLKLDRLDVSIRKINAEMKRETMEQYLHELSVALNTKMLLLLGKIPFKSVTRRRGRDELSYALLVVILRRRITYETFRDQQAKVGGRHRFWNWILLLLWKVIFHKYK